MDTPRHTSRCRTPAAYKVILHWGLGRAAALTALWVVISLLPLARASATDSIVCADDDNDGTITKLKASGLVDRDCDGEIDSGSGGTDCDDTNPLIHDQSYVRVDSTHYKYCHAGTYTSGTTATLAECAVNYYIDPGAGLNSNNCTSPSTACADFTKLSSGGALAALGGASQTCIYLMGTSDLTTASGFFTTVSGPGQRTKNIIARYPTSLAKLNLTCSSGSPCAAIQVEGNNWIVRGFEITGGYGGGVAVFGNNVEIVDNYIHDVQGSENNNIAGIYLADGYNNSLIHHNIVNNTFDPSQTSATGVRQNVFGITMFTGQGNIIEHNVVGYSQAPNTSPYDNQGGGIRSKHGIAVANVITENQFRDNVVYNTEYPCFDAGAAGVWITGNLCVGSSHCTNIHSAGGGTYALYDVEIENNTCVPGIHATGGVTGGGAIDFADTPDDARSHGVFVTGNVIDDSAQTTYGGGNHIDLIDDFHYGTSTVYTQVVTGTALAFARNCYYNSGISGLTGGFDVFGNGPGSIVNFSNWHSTYQMDRSSYNENVALDASMRATSTHCTGSGWERAWPGANIVGGCDFYDLGGVAACF